MKAAIYKPGKEAVNVAFSTNSALMAVAINGNPCTIMIFLASIGTL